jgi:excinuclease ABC subunit A
MVKNSDHVIVMVPDGGIKGGQIVDVGTPEMLAENYKKSGSYTGKYLAEEIS